ncbi:Probable Zinc-ribbon domain containing protein [Candidatus Nanopelagicaceae bacterium]
MKRFFPKSVVPNILIAVPGKKEKLPLSVTHPELAKEAVGWDASSVTPGSHQKKEWQCKLNHTWITEVKSRTEGRGCPYCSNRKVLSGFNDIATTHPQIAAQANGWDPTKYITGTGRMFEWRCSEGHVWKATGNDRKSGYGCPFCSGRVPVIGVNDFATTHPILSRELVKDDPTGFSAGSSKRLEWKCRSGHIWKAVVGERTAGTGCPICAGKKVLAGFNDLGTTNPDLANEADGWDPSTLNAGSNKKVDWKCSFDHKWSAAVATRIRSGCPFCTNRKVLAGFNDLATTNPELAAEACGWDATTVTTGTQKRFKWICEKGHTWITSPANRNGVNKTGCPTCHIGGFDPNAPGYIYLLIHPLWLMLQIGITNYPDNRLHTHARSGWELIELRGPLDGHITQQWETAILRMLKVKGADLSNEKIAGKFDGYSEAWSKSTFEAKSIKELMRLTEEFEGNR